MELAVNVAQTLVGHMSIDLRGDDIFMTQEFLDASQIHSLVAARRPELRAKVLPKLLLW